MKENKAIDKLIDFLSESNEIIDSSQEGLKRFDIGLASLLQRAETLQRKSWKVRARLQLDEIKKKADERFKSFVEVFGGEDGLFEAIRSGKLTLDQLGGASVHFRNREIDKLSKEEVIKILRDQKLLEVKKELENGSSDE